MKGIVRSRSSPIFVNFGSLFLEHRFLTVNISDIFVCSQRNLACLRSDRFPEFRELWFEGFAMPGGHLRQSFADSLVAI